MNEKAAQGDSLGTGALAVGVDVVDLERFRQAVGRRPAIAERLFTPAERELAASSADPAKRLAVRFAAKEAVMKALGVGIGGVSFREVEVCRGPTGAPSLALSGTAAARAERLGLRAWHLSMSHSDLVAVATVVAERCVE
jgi:holo-[acyl-carrier protein] synthase